MYEELYASLPDVSAYLDRIGLASLPIRQDLETLNKILYAHVQTVPFENLEACDAGRVPDLGIPALFEKVVKRRRGGWCHELNALLEALLRALGFKVYSVGGRVLTAPFTVPIGHRAVIATLEGKKYYCDVGFGDLAFQNAIPFDGTASAFGFHLVREGDWYEVRRGDWRIIAFADLAYEPVDFLYANFAEAMDPGSLFRSSPYISILQGQDRLLLQGDTLTRQRPGAEKEVLAKAAGREARSPLLKEYFGIDCK